VKTADELVDVLGRLKILKTDRRVAPEWVAAISPYWRNKAQNDCGTLKEKGAAWEINEVEYLRKHWLGSRQNKNDCAFWSGDAGPVVAMVKRALIELATIKLEKGARVASYWVCAGKDDDPFKDPSSPGFRCYVAWAPGQITFLVLTPEEPDPETEAGEKLSLHHVPDKNRPDVQTGRGPEYDAAVSAAGHRSGIVVVKPDPQDPAAKVEWRAYDLAR
jgi:hypothetical protein